MTITTLLILLGLLGLGAVGTRRLKPARVKIKRRGK